jgi:hypothetical protein
VEEGYAWRENLATGSLYNRVEHAGRLRRASNHHDTFVL